MLINGENKVPRRALESLFAEIGNRTPMMGSPDQVLSRFAGQGEEGVRKLTDLLSRHKGLGRNILGNVADEKMLKNLVTDEALRKNLYSRGIGRRPGRTGAMLGLLGAGAYGLNKLWQGYKHDSGVRNNAQEVLQRFMARPQGQ